MTAAIVVIMIRFVTEYTALFTYYDSFLTRYSAKRARKLTIFCETDQPPSFNYSFFPLLYLTYLCVYGQTAMQMPQAP